MRTKKQSSLIWLFISGLVGTTLLFGGSFELRTSASGPPSERPAANGAGQQQEDTPSAEKKLVEWVNMLKGTWVLQSRVVTNNYGPRKGPKNTDTEGRWYWDINVKDGKIVGNSMVLETGILHWWVMPNESGRYGPRTRRDPPFRMGGFFDVECDYDYVFNEQDVGVFRVKFFDGDLHGSYGGFQQPQKIIAINVYFAQRGNAYSMMTPANETLKVEGETGGDDYDNNMWDSIDVEGNNRFVYYSTKYGVVDRWRRVSRDPQEGLKGQSLEEYWKMLNERGELTKKTKMKLPPAPTTIRR